MEAKVKGEKDVDNVEKSTDATPVARSVEEARKQYEGKPGAQRYPHVFDPIEIRGRVFRNRLIAAPTMFFHAAYFIPQIRENIYRMVEVRAKGGFGCVATGELPLNFEEGRGAFMDRAIDVRHFYGSDFDSAKEYADRIHSGGALAYMEISHEGLEADDAAEPWGPCDIVREDGRHVFGMDRQMMDKVCNDFFQVGRFAHAAGFDGVLLHGGHGFLIQQFVSPLFNHRTDEFGGSIQNRSRFPKMVLRALRAGMGEDMVLELRMSAEDGEKGGMTLVDSCGFAEEIDGLVDIFHVSNGIKKLGNGGDTFSDIFDPHGVNLERAAAIKPHLHKSLVAVVGGFNSVAQAEDAIAAGKVDFVEYARQCFADPDFINKTLDGHEDMVHRCVRCFHCYPGFCEHPTDIPLWYQLPPEEFMKVYSPAVMGDCSINPDSGLGYYPDRLPKPTASRRVLVVGGGVGGMQAAITAARRGHKVTLAEKGDRLGGVLLFAEHDHDKREWMDFEHVLERELRDLNVDVQLGTSVDGDYLRKTNPEYVILAVGAHDRACPLPGAELAMSATDTYFHMDEIGHTVVIAGGGLTACETALNLAAAGHEVTVVARKPRLTPSTFGYYRNALLDEMDKRGIHQLLSTCPMEFTKGGLVCQKAVDDKGTPGGEHVVVPADTYVYSFGMDANTDEAERLTKAAEALGAKVFNIGNSKEPGTVHDAVHGGDQAAMAVL
ncbi:MAG: FAD-dependent oxidoreductase [Coriobacteriaceae bacterium]|jgi:2,4-dienoyl-CoA reductase-like NADH-dependent reductase (Old Yellow Enzyme family)/thioredoxin reductase|nr:FAD-dependent oxidoreductase [Olsenella sp.]RRF89591.1 MAG: FAD-dependent oxidoreductase [Coriobacteriaceae bacterium]